MLDTRSVTPTHPLDKKKKGSGAFNLAHSSPLGSAGENGATGHDHDIILLLLL